MEVVNKTLVTNINNAFNAENSNFQMQNDSLNIKTEKIENFNDDEKFLNKDKEYSKKELDNALKKINNFLKDEKTHAEYSIHDDLGTLMIKVIDDDSKKVILEIPPKKILDLVASMCKQMGLIDKRA